VRVSSSPLVRLSAIDVSPEHPQRTFLFVHGFGGQAEQWNYQLQEFLMENRVIALDLRGHGLSDRPSRGYEMERILLDVEVALDVLKVQGKIVLVGHSFGGAIAAEYALKHPEQVERLVLIATAGQFRLRPFYRLGLALPNWLLQLAGVWPHRRVCSKRSTGPTCQSGWAGKSSAPSKRRPWSSAVITTMSLNKASSRMWPRACRMRKRRTSGPRVTWSCWSDAKL